MLFRGNKKSLQNNRDYLDKIPFAVAVHQIIFDDEGQASDLMLLDINKCIEKDTGKTRDQLIGQKITHLYPEIKQKLVELFSQYGDHLEIDNQFEFELHLDFMDKWYNINISVISKKELLIVYSDCTDRKIADQKLMLSEKRFKSHFENSTIGIYRTSPEGEILMANPALLNLLEFSSFEELAERNLEKESYKMGYRRNEYKEAIEESGSIIGWESVWETKSGKKIHVRESARVVRNSADGILFYEGTVEDVSEKRIAEIQLSRLNHLFYDLKVDPKLNFDIIVNRACEILDGAFCFYSQFDTIKQTYEIIAESNLPEDFERKGSLEGFSSYKMFKDGQNKPVAIYDIQKMDLILSDPVFNKYNIVSIIGSPLFLKDKLVGSLCVMHTKSTSYTETEKEILGTLAIALSIEQTRYIVEQDLKKATREAKEANRAKDQFLANMSHEIRTPLNGVIGFSELLLSREKDPQKIRLLKLVEDSGNHLLCLINDLFDYSRIETSSITLVENDFNLIELVEEALDFHKSKLEIAKLKVILNKNGQTEQWVKGDGYKLRLILSNLIGNAIKFTNEGTINIGIEVLHVKKELVEATISIEDTGVGIEKEQLANIFDEFKQVEHYLTKKNQGTGLGLTIVKKLLDFMGGSINVKSKPGIGSKFVITLPFKPSGQNKSIEIMNIPEENPKSETQSIRILLAEDNEANQFLIKAITRSHDWDITVVGDGEQAVVEFEKNQFDLILMDVQMPVMNGYEATKIIRQKEAEKENGERIPIIALTAYAMKADKDRCIEAGMDDYISKPFKRQEFLDRIILAIEEGK
jgi:PAS domain S-box-containing protein